MRKLPKIKKPIPIGLNDVYTIEAATEALGLPARCLSREIRLKRLQFAKRAGRYFFLGQWLVDWIKVGSGQTWVLKAAG